MKKFLCWCALVGLLLPTATFAATPEPEAVAIVQDALKATTDGIFNDLQSWGVRLLSLFVLIQFTLTNISQLGRDSDISAVWAKFVGSILWFSFCFYVMDAGAPFMQETAKFFYGKAGAIAGGSFTPGYAMNFGLALTNNLLVALDNTQGILASLNPFPSIMLGVVSVAILIVSALIAFKIFMLIAETAIVIALSPLSFALLGLNALKDQGLSPLKYLIAMGYRAIILGAVIAAMSKLGVHINAVFEKIPSLTDTGVWTPIWAATLGYSLLGMFAMKADSIAAMLASGTSQMSTGDAASSVAAAAAAGGMIGGGVVASGGLMRDVVSGVKAGATSAGSALGNISSGLKIGNATDVIGEAPKKSDFSKNVADAPPLKSVLEQDANQIESASDPIAAANKEQSAAYPGAAPGSGTPNQLPELEAANSRKAERDAARELRRQDKATGSGATAGIGGVASEATGSGRSRGLLDQMSEANRHIAQETAVVSVSLNAHAEH